MSQLSFDRSVLARRLQEIAEPCRAAFAASCAERMMENYEAFAIVEGWGDFALIRRCLDRVWQHLGSDRLDALEAATLVASCQNAAPDTERFGSVLAGLALDAAGAVSIVVEVCIGSGSPSVERTCQVAEWCADSVYRYLLAVGDPKVEPHILSPDLEEWVLSSPLYQAELASQSEDLDALVGVLAPSRTVLESLRAASVERGIRLIARGLVQRL